MTATSSMPSVGIELLGGKGKQTGIIKDNIKTDRHYEKT